MSLSSFEGYFNLVKLEIIREGVHLYVRLKLPR